MACAGVNKVSTMNRTAVLIIGLCLPAWRKNPGEFSPLKLTQQSGSEILFHELEQHGTKLVDRHARFDLPREIPCRPISRSHCRDAGLDSSSRSSPPWDLQKGARFPAAVVNPGKTAIVQWTADSAGYTP